MPSRREDACGKSRKASRKKRQRQTRGYQPETDKVADPRRDRIVRMAAPLFLKKGYDNVSIDEIIGVVGGSKATIYAWFGGKQGLFEAVVRQKCDDVTLSIDIDTRGTLEEQLTRIGHSFLDTVLTPPIMEFHRLMVSIGRTFPEAGRLFFEGGPANAYSIVAEWIEQTSEGRQADRRGPVSPRGAVSRHADRRASARLADRMPRAAQQGQDRRDGAHRGQGLPARHCEIAQEFRIRNSLDCSVNFAREFRIRRRTGRVLIEPCAWR